MFLLLGLFGSGEALKALPCVSGPVHDAPLDVDLFLVKIRKCEPAAAEHLRPVLTMRRVLRRFCARQDRVFLHKGHL